MKQDILSPCVKHGEKAELGPEVLRIRRDGVQSLGGGTEENAVNHSLVLTGDRGDLLWHGEYDMEVRHLEEFGLPVLDPLGASQALALRAVLR
jgi:hypothetical protein